MNDQVTFLDGWRFVYHMMISGPVGFAVGVYAAVAVIEIPTAFAARMVKAAAVKLPLSWWYVVLSIAACIAGLILTMLYVYPGVGL